jgi:hypothetical protein
MIELSPIGSISELCSRIQDCEASIGEKLLLFEVLGNAASALSDRPTESGKSKMKLEEVMLK